MKNWEKYALPGLIAIFLILICSTTAFAEASAPQFVLYENPDGDFILANYEDAIELISTSGKYQLYNKIVEDIQVALYNFREVYVILEDEIIFYSLAVLDAKNLVEAYNDGTGKYSVAQSSLPDPDLELYLNGNLLAYRNPVPIDGIDWLEINYAWHDLANCWFINAIIDESAFSLDYPGKDLTNINSISYNGVEGTRSDNVFRFRTFNKNSEPDVSLVRFKVYVDGSSLW